jgi:hypothetical protein
MRDCETVGAEWAVIQQLSRIYVSVSGYCILDHLLHVIECLAVAIPAVLLKPANDRLFWQSILFDELAGKTKRVVAFGCGESVIEVFEEAFQNRCSDG